MIHYKIKCEGDEPDCELFAKGIREKFDCVHDIEHERIRGHSEINFTSDEHIRPFDIHEIIRGDNPVQIRYLEFK